MDVKDYKKLIDKATTKDELQKDAGKDEKTLEPQCSIFCGLINLGDQ